PGPRRPPGDPAAVPAARAPDRLLPRTGADRARLRDGERVARPLRDPPRAREPGPEPRLPPPPTPPTPLLRQQADTSGRLPTPKRRVGARRTSAAACIPTGRGLSLSPGMEVEVVVEIPKGSRNKYEADHDTGAIWLDRHLFTATTYPTDYGFVP